MRIGVCTDISKLEEVQKIGFDYIESSVTGIMALEQDVFESICETVAKSDIKCEALNVFFPSDIRIVGPDVDTEKVFDYVHRVFERIPRVGAQVVVIGSGRARTIPEGWDKEKAMEQMAEVLAKIGSEAAIHNITAVVEPLNRKESNMINSVTEGLSLVKSVNHPNIKLLADFYHMQVETEDMLGIREASKLLQHVHIANSNGRVYPKSMEEDGYNTFFKALRESNYNGRISIEASTNDFASDAPVSLKFLREILK